MMKTKTIKEILTKNILFVAVLPMLVSTIVLILFLLNYVRVDRTTDQKKQIENVESNLKLIFGDVSNVLDEANYNLENKLIKEDSINDYLEVLVSKHPIFDSIRRIDQKGSVINAPSSEKDIIGFDISYQGYYQEAQKSIGTYWSNIFLSQYTSEVSIAVLINNPDGTMLVGFCSLVELQKTLDSILLSSVEKIAIVDKNGVYIAHNNFKRVKERQHEIHLKEIKEDEIQLFKYGNTRMFVTSKQLNDQNLTIISYFDFYKTYIVVWQVIGLSILSIFIIFFIVIIISKILSKPIIGEISELISKTSEISTGRYGTKLEPSQYFEFNELTHNFNLMSSTIQENFLQLSDSQAELEILNEELMAQNDEIRKSEMQISSILNNIYDGIMMVDEKGNVLWINDSVYEHFGVEKKEFTKRTKCYQIIYNNKSKCHYCDMEKIKETKEKTSKIIKVSDKLIEETHIPIFDQANQFVAVIKTFKDITERVTLEAKLNSAIKMEAIGRLTGGISHDFNNILQIIIGYSDLIMTQMQMSQDNEKMLSKMTVIYDAATKAEKLIKQLMTFSKIDQVSPINLNLNDVVIETGTMLTKAIGSDIKLEITLDEKIPEICADPTQMEQIIMNLCMNAKHAIGNEGKIAVQTNAVQKCGLPYVALIIKDTGTGISDSIKAKIFDPFFTTKELGKGTGLGLAIVLGIVEKHEGLIELETEIGKGTTFTIFFPTTKSKTVSYLPDTQLSDYSPLKGLKVLVAEDEESIRGITVTALHKHGIKVIEAADGRDAINNFTPEINLLILDVIMPGLNGVEVYETIKKEHPEIKVIFTTGYSSDYLGKDYNLALQGKILQKPYKIIALMNTILEVLDL